MLLLYYPFGAQGKAPFTKMPDPMQALPDIIFHPPPQCRAYRSEMPFWVSAGLPEGKFNKKKRGVLSQQRGQDKEKVFKRPAQWPFG